ncbi:hypothetical protein AB3Y40_14820 [Yoonia sp. R2331]|uniref:hypothetical protein n=1 Tax=Yoonia sp. R2331 TaxID=3237238 RepID=UPI0034E586DE
MRHLLKVLCATCFLLPAAAHSERFADGTLALGVLTQNDIQTRYAFGDFSLGATYGAWGAELGFFGVVGRLHETYANLSYRAGDATFRVGFPRPAYDLVAPSALTAMMPRAALDDIGRSRSRATYGTMFEPDFLPYGASVAHNFGTGRAYASSHGFPNQDVTIAGFGFTQHRGEFTYALAAEAVAENDAITWNTKAQATAKVGYYSLGLGLFNPAANGLPRMAEVSASYTWDGGTTLTGVYRAAQDGASDLTLGLRQPITRAIDLQAAVRQNETGETRLSAEIALNF